MSSDDAAEQRRLRILRNSERRLEMLLGVKKEEGESSDSITITNQKINNEITNSESETRIHQRRHSNEVRKSSVVVGTNTEPIAPLQNQQKQEISSNDVCHFTGHSNLELIILTLLALITSVLFFIEKSDLIFDNVLLPFVTFQFSHLIMHYNSLPSNSSSHVISYINLLKLFGIRQTVIKNFITTLNFFFVLIDNFVIYLFCFILSSILLHSINALLLF